MNDSIKISELFDLNETIAADIFDGCTFPWEVLSKIGDFIVKLGNTLPESEYEKRGENVWVAKSAKVFDSAYINGPCIIGKDAEVRHCAFIRGNAIVGEGAVVGNSTELKNVILFNKVQVPHYNYVGDSVLGNRSHLGAGVICANLRLDKGNVIITLPEGRINSNMRKLGAMLADEAEAGCNSVLQPGAILMKRSIVLSGFAFKGYLEENTMAGPKLMLRKLPRFGF